MNKLGKDPELNALMKKVNKRITILERSYNIIYQQQTDAIIERMRRTAEQLTGSGGRTIKKGDLKAEDVNRYKRAMRGFLESDMSTVTGQNRIMAEAKQAYEKKYGEISERDYKRLTKIMESDEFAIFKEKFGMYGNIVKDMTTSVKSYKQATDYIRAYTQGDTKALEKMLENNKNFKKKLEDRLKKRNIDVDPETLDKEMSKYLDELTNKDGSLNVQNFIDGWNSLR